jgi:hypothetical protein
MAVVYGGSAAQHWALDPWATVVHSRSQPGRWFPFSKVADVDDS